MTAPNPRLISLNTGGPKHLGTMPDGSPFISSIARQPVAGPIKLGIPGFEGDACEYRGHHGLQMAVNVFAIEDYPYYEALGGKPLPRPAFGENLTLEGYTDQIACVGDVVRVGTALLQVSQPREPCGNIVRFHAQPRMVRWIEDARRTGFYLRVLEPGVVAPDSTIDLVEQGDTRWTIAALSDAMYSRETPEEVLEALQGIESLSPNWKSSLIRRTRRVHGSKAKGLATTS